MKYTRFLFICAFLIILFAPLITFNWKGTFSKEENRILVAAPKITKNGKFNTKIFARTSDYIDDHFGLRLQAIDLATAINHDFFHDKSNSEGVIGKDQWLFYLQDNNLADFFKTDLFTADELEKFRIELESRKKWCDKNNIKFLVFITPNKHNVYPEYYPFARPTGLNRTEHLLAYLNEKKSDVEVIYPLDSLVKAKKNYQYPIYLETDTHWNASGAYEASKVINDRIKTLFPQASYVDYSYDSKIEAPTCYGDMVRLLGFSHWRNMTTPVYTPRGSQWTDIYSYIINDGVNGVITQNKNSSLPKAIVFRDSFWNFLEPFVSVNLSKSDCRWKQFEDSDKESILADKPDIIIWEVVERFTPKMLAAAWDISK